MAAKLSDTYVVHCAVTRCDMGIRESKLVLEKSHGVYIKELAQASIKDMKAENIVCFGGCISAENPKTLEKAKELAKEIKDNTGVDFTAIVEDVFTRSNAGGKRVMECAGECIPLIVSAKWDGEKEDVIVETGQRALMGEATLTCEHGGIIKIIDAGQPE